MIRISEHMQFPVEVIVGKKAGFLGKSNSGKSYTALRFCEQLLRANIPVIVIDPMSQFRVLTEHYPVILAGGSKRAHVPLTVRGAAALADFVYRQRMSVVLDVNTVDGVQDTALVEAFLGHFWRLVKQTDIDDHHEPFTIVVDEAQYYVPQGAVTPVSQTIIDIAKTGRHRKIGLLVASQRGASIDKNFLTMANLLICHRVIATDADYVAEIAGVSSAKVKGIVRTFQPGAALVLGDPDLVNTGTDDYIVTRVDLPDVKRGATDQQAALNLAALQPMSTEQIEALRAALMVEPERDRTDRAGNGVESGNYQRLEQDNADLVAQVAQARARIATLEADLAEALANLAVALHAAPAEPIASNGHAPVVAEADDDDAPVRSERSLKLAANRERAQFDRLKQWIRQTPKPFQIDVMAYLVYFENEWFTVRQLCRVLKLSESSLFKNAPTYLIDKGILERDFRDGRQSYRSAARRYIKATFPTLDTDALLTELIQMGSETRLQHLIATLK